MVSKKAATIRDVSKAAGVSVATVSRVINNTGNVKKHAQDKVLDALKELNYKPNIAARRLKTNKSSIIFYLAPEMSNPYFSEIYDGVKSIANENGYTTFMNEVSDVKKALHTTITHGVDGVIIDALYMNKTADELKASNIPYIITNAPAQLEIENAVKIDLFKATTEVISYLQFMGHREIGLITYRPKKHTIRERLRAFLEYAERYNIEDYKSCIVEDISSTNQCRDGFEAMNLLMNRMPNLTAVIVLNDATALGAVSAITQRGFSIPNDISIVSFDNTNLSKYSNPPISSVNIPKYKQGQIAARMLLEQLQNKNTEGYSVTMQTNIIKRKSVADLRLM